MTGDNRENTATKLEKLADLFARGVITEDDFNAKKRQLLGAGGQTESVSSATGAARPVAQAPLAPPPPRRSRSPIVPIVIIFGVLVVLLLAGGLLWASGMLGSLGQEPTQTVASVSAAPVPPAASSTIVAPPILPVEPTPPPAPAVAEVIPNPLLGQWVSDTGGGSNCGGGLAFGESTVTITQPDGNGGMKAETNPLTYAVLSPASVTLFPTNNPGQSKEIQIVDGHFTLESCDFHR